MLRKMLRKTGRLIINRLSLHVTNAELRRRKYSSFFTPTFSVCQEANNPFKLEMR